MAIIENNLKKCLMLFSHNTEPFDYWMFLLNISTLLHCAAPSRIMFCNWKTGIDAIRAINNNIPMLPSMPN